MCTVGRTWYLVWSPVIEGALLLLCIRGDQNSQVEYLGVFTLHVECIYGYTLPNTHTLAKLMLRVLDSPTQQLQFIHYD